MVEVLVILDGASEPLAEGGAPPTSLERARTPVLDRLAGEGDLTRLRTVAPWLCAGSESAIPALLGWTPTSAVDRGAIEAAAHEIGVAPGERAWRVDVVAVERVEFVAPRATNSTSAVPGASIEHAGRSDMPGVRAGRSGVPGARVGQSDRPGARVGQSDRPGDRAGEAEATRAAATLRVGAPLHAVHRLGGHRLLLVGPAPLPPAARAPGLRVWPDGIVPPHVLGVETVVIGARGAAIGIGRLMGAATVVPAGATGRPGSDLAAKAAAALDAIAAGAPHVVVHVGGPDEAAHLRDRAAKVAAIEDADRDLLGPLVAAIRTAGGTLRVCPDHGCDPATGAHDAQPVPCVTWLPRPAVPCDVAPRDGAPRDDMPRSTVPRDGVPRPGSTGGERRLTERAVASMPIAELASASTLAVA